VVFSASLDGHVRAFSTEDGEMLWDFDTAQTYSTVNGVPAKAVRSTAQARSLQEA
jgi:polyvinyl alcohol dehydrogenase (cytochrome)